MKNASFLIFVLLLSLSDRVWANGSPDIFVGAWETTSGTDRIVMICSEKYFSAAVFNNETRTFTGTCGGSYNISGERFIEMHEFNTMQPDLIGKKKETEFELKNNVLKFNDGTGKVWKKIEGPATADLSGAWLITGRMQNGEMTKITPGVRKTMKILSGNRFQWIAYNSETKEFLGTGGGRYGTRDGLYTEIIEFFSRDSSRVGSQLSFDFAIEDGKWRHKGLSSKGDPIDEVWTKREELGL